MMPTRFMKIFAITCLFIVQGCVIFTHRTSDNRTRPLPNLYNKDYVKFKYVDSYTGMESKLSMFWAQEISSVPEGRLLMQVMQRNNFPFATPDIGIIDTGMDIKKSGHARFSEKLNKYIDANYEEEIKPLLAELVEMREEANIHNSLGHGTRTLGIIVGESTRGSEFAGASK